MRLARLVLVATVLVAVYVAALPVVAAPRLGLLYLAVFLAAACRKARKPLTSYGTARWADIHDLGGMTDGD